MVKTHRVCVALLVGLFFTLTAAVQAADYEKYLADDTEAVIQLNVKQVLASPMLKDVLGEAKTKLAGQAGALKELGFDPFRDLEYVIIGIPGGGNVEKAVVLVRVLDGFCYTGGFGLHALRAGASEVLGVDVSEPALALAQENARLNGLDRIRFVRSDVFDYLGELVASGERFGLVVLDPPKFARRRGAVEEALRGYRRLQTLALRLLEADGIFVMCCCSGLITMAMLEELLAQVAVEECREVQILERRGQAPDHPVAVTCLESNYLKCLICRVL